MTSGMPFVTTGTYAFSTLQTFVPQGKHLLLAIAAAFYGWRCPRAAFPLLCYRLRWLARPRHLRRFERDVPRLNETQFPTLVWLFWAVRYLVSEMRGESMFWAVTARYIDGAGFEGIIIKSLACWKGVESVFGVRLLGVDNTLVVEKQLRTCPVLVLLSSVWEVFHTKAAPVHTFFFWEGSCPSHLY